MEVFGKKMEKSLALVFKHFKGKIVQVRKMNINNRLLRILDFLEYNSITSIKEVSKALDVSERIVRYEIDNLNFILKLHKFFFPRFYFNILFCFRIFAAIDQCLFIYFRGIIL